MNKRVLFSSASEHWAPPPELQAPLSAEFALNFAPLRQSGGCRWGGQGCTDGERRQSYPAVPPAPFRSWRRSRARSLGALGTAAIRLEEATLPRLAPTMPPRAELPQHIFTRIIPEVLSSGLALDCGCWCPRRSPPSHPVEAFTNQSQQKRRPIDRPARRLGDFGPRRVNLPQ